MAAKSKKSKARLPKEELKTLEPLLAVSPKEGEFFIKYFNQISTVLLIAAGFSFLKKIGFHLDKSL